MMEVNLDPSPATVNDCRFVTKLEELRLWKVGDWFSLTEFNSNQAS
jgi:hypothetical protein